MSQDIYHLIEHQKKCKSLRVKPRQRMIGLSDNQSALFNMTTFNCNEAIDKINKHVTS